MDMWVRDLDENKIKTSSKLYSQTINFNGLEDKQGIEILGQDVTVHCSSGNHNHGSSKVKLTSIVDYNWEPKLYVGQLIAVHMSGKYIAYGIKVQKAAQNVALVRVTNHNGEKRTLLRGMKGQIQDISFAFIPNQYILGCVDEEASLFVFNIVKESNDITGILLLHIVHTPDPTVSNYHRILWCPYMPEEDPSIDPVDDDGAKLLVLTHGCKAEMWNVNQVITRHGVGPHNSSDIEEGFLEINEHKLPIIDAAFSPDGTALATASLDGDVKFFQVYMHNDSKPRCLHQWQPHDGKALSCLFFLDDHHTYIPDVQFWKFAITGCDNNSEIKVWSCESWSCLQTINFVSPTNTNSTICLKAGIDNGAGYFILSDVQNKLLYVLQIQKDLNEASAKVHMISEFYLQSPILSYGIVDAGIRKLKCSASTEDLYQVQDGTEAEEGNIVATTIRMYVVQPKSLQECRIAYQSNYVSSNISAIASNQDNNIMFRNDGIAELNSNAIELDQVTNNTNSSETATVSKNLIPIKSEAPALNLMTPDSFNSPVQDISPESKPIEHTIEQQSSTNDLVESVTNGDDLIVFQRSNFASGGSSPSREVQEILSTYPDNDYYEESNDTNNDENSTVAKIIDSNSKITESNNFVENDDIEWTKIPIMKVSEVIQSMESRIIPPPVTSLPPPTNHTSDIKDSAHSTPIISKENNIIEYTSTDSDESSLVLKVISKKLISMEEIIQQQNLMLQNLQQQISTMNRSQETQAAAAAAAVANSSNSQLEQNHTQFKHLIASQIDVAFNRNLAEQNKLLENWMFKMANKERENQDHLLSAISQVIGNSVLSKLDTIVTQEVQKNIVPQIINNLELLKRQLHSEMTQKLTTTDHLLKENITKLVTSKSVMDVLSSSIISALRPHIETSYKEILSNKILPSWERVCQTMFQQIHDTFSQGTKEYTVCLETHLEKQRRQQEKGRDIVTQLQGVSDSMRTNSEHLANSLSNEIQQQIQKICSSFQETMKKTIRQEVKEQIDRGFRNHAAVLEDSVLNAVKSRAVTPSPHILDSHVQQSQIQQLITQGQLNAAFQLALSASDLSLVVYTCEKVNPQQVFNQTPCPLQQNVLLSLIQQLSADMSNHTEIKYKYLEEAVMNLQATNPMTREHMPVVLKELQRQLNAYINCNPNNKITRQMRMLLMATQSLIQ